MNLVRQASGNMLMNPEEIKERVSLNFFVMKDGHTVVAVRGGKNMSEWSGRFNALIKQYLAGCKGMEVVHLANEVSEGRS